MAIHNPTGGASNVIDGFTLSNLTTGQLDAKVFNDCTFLTNDTSVSHQVNGTGSVTVSETTGGTFYIKGSPSEITANTYTGNGEEILSVVTAQTADLEAFLNPGVDFGGGGSVLTLTADNVTNFTLGPFGPADNTSNITEIDLSACITVDFTDYSGDGLNSNNAFSVNFGSALTSLAIVAATIAAGSDTWNGSWTDDGITNAILAAYVAGSSSGGTLTIGGASPTGQGIADSATLTLSGVTVATN